MSDHEFSPDDLPRLRQGAHGFLRRHAAHAWEHQHDGDRWEITLPYLSECCPVRPVRRDDRVVRAGQVWLSCWLPMMAREAWPPVPLCLPDC
jgi:hypothetical protein